jgi:hypothetical protein
MERIEMSNGLSSCMCKRKKRGLVPSPSFFLSFSLSLSLLDCFGMGEEWKRGGGRRNIKHIATRRAVAKGGGGGGSCCILSVLFATDREQTGQRKQASLFTAASGHGRAPSVRPSGSQSESELLRQSISQSKKTPPRKVQRRGVDMCSVTVSRELGQHLAK